MKSFAWFVTGADGRKFKLVPDDLEFIETRQFTAREIARVFRVPPELMVTFTRPEGS